MIPFRGHQPCERQKGKGEIKTLKKDVFVEILSDGSHELKGGEGEPLKIERANPKKTAQYKQSKLKKKGGIFNGKGQRNRKN